MSENDDLVCVFKGSLMQINWLKEFLGENNIDCFSRNKSMEAMHSGFASTFSDDVELYVNAIDELKTRELLELNQDSIQNA